MLAGGGAETLGPALKWEPSRGGALFPHLYGPLPLALAVEAEATLIPQDSTRPIRPSVRSGREPHPRYRRARACATWSRRPPTALSHRGA